MVSQLEALALGQVARRAADEQGVAAVGDDLPLRALVEGGQVGAIEAEGDDRALARAELLTRYLSNGALSACAT
jgi:hypothetical protein